MSRRNILAIIFKHILDSIRNPIILFLMILYPVMTLVFMLVMGRDSEPFTFLFATMFTMHITMCPMLIFSNVISEEKEKNTLRLLFMSNVKPLEYLSGIGVVNFFLLLISIVPYIFFDILIKDYIFEIYLFAFVGMLCSGVLGASIGIISKSQMSVGIMTAPISMIIGLLPMLANMNIKIKDVSKFVYSQKIYDVVFDNGNVDSYWSFENISIMIINLLLFLIIFFLSYRNIKRDS